MSREGRTAAAETTSTSVSTLSTCTSLSLLTLTVPSSDAVKQQPPALPAVRPRATAETAKVWSLSKPYGFPYGVAESSSNKRDTRKTCTAASSDDDTSSDESLENDRVVTAR